MTKPSDKWHLSINGQNKREERDTLRGHIYSCHFLFFCPCIFDLPTHPQNLYLLAQSLFDTNDEMSCIYQ